MAFITPLLSPTFTTPLFANTSYQRSFIRKQYGVSRSFRRTNSPCAMTTTSPSPVPTTKPVSPAFDWLNQWYPISTEADVPRDRPFGFMLWDRRYVLFKDTATGNYVAFDDVCSHRCAPLSDGRIFQWETDKGKQTVIECGYHGWRFNRYGTCVDIPQTASSSCIPQAANLKRSYPTSVAVGLVFVWIGDKVPDKRPPAPSYLYSYDQKRITFYRDTARMFPMSFTTILENIVDPAHVAWAHHGMGVSRNWSKPSAVVEGLNMQEGETDVYIGGDFYVLGKGPGIRYKVYYQAPCLAVWDTEDSVQVPRGLLIYCTPISARKTLMITHHYVVDGKWRFRFSKWLTPRWYEHVLQNQFLDGDSWLLYQQEAHLHDVAKAGAQTPWKKSFLLAAGKMDTLITPFRSWLDRQQQNMPFLYIPQNQYESFSREYINDRWENHSRMCSSCGPALQNAKRGKVLATVIALVGLCMAICGALLIGVGSKAIFIAVAGLILSSLGAGGVVACEKVIMMVMGTHDAHEARVGES